jgi:hypothetical protein
MRGEDSNLNHTSNKPFWFMERRPPVTGLAAPWRGVYSCKVGDVCSECSSNILCVSHWNGVADSIHIRHLGPFRHWSLFRPAPSRQKYKCHPAKENNNKWLTFLSPESSTKELSSH